MKIIRNGETIGLTSDELFAAYYEQQHKFFLDEAETQLLAYLGLMPEDLCEDESPDYDEDDAPAVWNKNAIMADFEDTYGFSLSEAINVSSEHYLLYRIVSEFECRDDGERSVSLVWEKCVYQVLKETLEAQTASETSKEEKDG